MGWARDRPAFLDMSLTIWSAGILHLALRQVLPPSDLNFFLRLRVACVLACFLHASRGTGFHHGTPSQFSISCVHANNACFVMPHAPIIYLACLLCVRACVRAQTMCVRVCLQVPRACVRACARACLLACVRARVRACALACPPPSRRLEVLWVPHSAFLDRLVAYTANYKKQSGNGAERKRS